MDELTKFRHSSDKLMEFLNRWAKPLEEKCENNNASSQQKASYYLWARYSISVKTLKHICKIEFFPDLCVIGRCCLEFSASLKAVLSDKQAANDYLEFEKHAKAGYQRYLKNKSEAEKAAQLEEHLSELGVENLDDYKRKKWCKEGYAKLVENYKGSKERELYSLFSDFAHGSVIAIRILQNQPPFAKLLEKTIKTLYSDYILSTKSFLDEVWGQIVTTESDKCNKDFDGVARLAL
ncbi:hypothetical protein ES703_61168 [subsurface metagenome]